MAIFRKDSAACPTCPYGQDAERRRNRSVYNGRTRYIALIKDVWVPLVLFHKIWQQAE